MLENTRRFAALLAVGALTMAAAPAAHADPADTAKCVAGATADFAKKTLSGTPYMPHNC